MIFVCSLILYYSFICFNLLNMFFFIICKQFLLDDASQMTVISLWMFFAANNPISKHPNVFLSKNLIEKIDFFIFKDVLFIGLTIIIVGKLSW